MGKTILTAAIAIALVATLMLASGASLIHQANSTKCGDTCVDKVCHNGQQHDPGCKPLAVAGPP